MEAGPDADYFRLCSFWDGTAAADDRPSDVRCFENGRLTLAGGRPLISGEPEDAIEALSAAAGPAGRGEAFLDHWGAGSYACARCGRAAYASAAKWRGPCAWPSFRGPVRGAVALRPVVGYNRYACKVAEVYCGGCHLFIGHAFEDAREKGDHGPECTGWRH